MNQREFDIKTISDDFALWELRISNTNALSLYDGNVISESILCEILNCIFDYNLKNVNADRKNAPAVDLGDKTNRIAFQITSTKTTTKIQETISKFKEHGLAEYYDELFVLILGKKQKNYPTFNIMDGLIFNKEKNILDFQDLLKIISYLPSSKIKQIKTTMSSSTAAVSSKNHTNAMVMQKKVIALKKRMEKDLLRKLSQDEYRINYYEPWIKFIYPGVIIRAVGDRTFPGGDPQNPKWLKTEFWNFYDYGIEFIGGGGRIIIDKEGYWDILDIGDERINNPEYRTEVFHVFSRLAFENIATYDTEPESYYGLPTIFCNFNINGWPYEEIRIGLMGVFKMERVTKYFDEEMRRKLKP